MHHGFQKLEYDLWDGGLITHVTGIRGCLGWDGALGSRYHHNKMVNFLLDDDTPWKFNIAPENGWLEDEFPFGIPYFQGLC